MTFPKIRLTWGNVLAIAATTVGTITEVAPDVIAVSPTVGHYILTAGALIGLVTKAAATVNHDRIPAAQKVDVGPIVLEKTGPLKTS